MLLNELLVYQANGLYYIYTQQQELKAMIYLVLGFLELCRYGVIIYAIYLVSISKMEIGTVLLIYSYYAKIITNFEVLGTINAEFQRV